MASVPRLGLFLFLLAPLAAASASDSPGPSRRFGHTSVATPSGLVVYGGYTFRSKPRLNGKTYSYAAMYDDVWRFVNATTGWQKLHVAPGAAGPGKRIFHSASYDPQQDAMIVFGGVSKFLIGVDGSDDNLLEECGDDGMWLLPFRSASSGGINASDPLVWQTLRPSTPLTNENCGSWFRVEARASSGSRRHAPGGGGGLNELGLSAALSLVTTASVSFSVVART